MACKVPRIRASRIAWAGQDQERSGEGRSAKVRAGGVLATAADNRTWKRNSAPWAELWAVVLAPESSPHNAPGYIFTDPGGDSLMPGSGRTGRCHQVHNPVSMTHMQPEQDQHADLAWAAREQVPPKDGL